MKYDKKPVPSEQSTKDEPQSDGLLYLATGVLVLIRDGISPAKSDVETAIHELSVLATQLRKSRQNRDNAGDLVTAFTKGHIAGSKNEQGKMLDELYPPNTRIEKNGDLYGGWEIEPKSLKRLKDYIDSNPQCEEEPDMEVIEVVIRAIKHELKYGKWGIEK
jgi:hypothetical protein